MSRFARISRMIFAALPEGSDVGRSHKLQGFPGGSQSIYRGHGYQIVKAKTPDALYQLSEGTSWDTKDVDEAEKYLSKGSVYIFFRNGVKFAQLFVAASLNAFQFLDVDSSQINLSPRVADANLIFSLKESGLWASVLLKFLASNKNEFDRAYKERDEKFEDYIQNNAERSLEYAQTFLGGRFLKGENAISKVAKTAFLYAKDIIKGRWKLGESAIATDAGYSYDYALYVVKGRWEPGEPAILKRILTTYYYARDVVRGRWPEGERLLASNHAIALQYATNVIKGRFPAGEKIMSEDPKTSYIYAKDVIKGRFPAGEHAIAQSPFYSKLYKEDFHVS